MIAGTSSGNISAGSSAYTKEGLHGLPLRPHAPVGRKKDLEMSQALILRGNVRLVNLTGPAGVGKTRFAVELASSVASEFDDGVATARSFGARDRQIFTTIVLPGAVPFLMAAPRRHALVGIVVGELYAAAAGIGYEIAVRAKPCRPTASSWASSFWQARRLC